MYPLLGHFNQTYNYQPVYSIDDNVYPEQHRYSLPSHINSLLFILILSSDLSPVSQVVLSLDVDLTKQNRQ